MSSLAWREYRLDVGMPHLVPGKLSEVELLKHLGAFQWTSIAGLVGRAPNEIRSEQGERLFASMIAVELCFGRARPLDIFDEGCTIHAHNRVGVFGHRLVEGLFVFDTQPVPGELLEGIRGASELGRLDLPWATMANAFVAHTPGSAGLTIAAPAAFAAASLPELERMPGGIAEQTRVERTGRIEGIDIDEAAALELHPRVDEPIVYPIVPESDLNGAGLLYCARYVAIANFGERVFLTERLARPFSAPLVACLSTEHRRIYYFANASPSDALRLTLQVRIQPPARAPAPERLRTMAHLYTRADLHRRSDGVLVASTLVRKALRVPGQQKSVLLEVERALANLAREGG